MNRQEILDRLSAFPYDRGEYWIVAGAAFTLMFALRSRRLPKTKA